MQDAANSERGDGFLKLRLDRELNISLRRGTALRDWLTATILVLLVQLLGTFAIDAWALVVLLFYLFQIKF